MAFCTVRGELLSDVVRIRGGIVVIGMATGTGVWCVVVITIVTSRAVVGDGCVCPDKLIEVIVNGESGWCPSRLGGVAGFAGCRQVECQVTWISASCIVIGMATCACCGRIGVVALVTVVTGHGCVRAREWPHGAVIERGRHPRILVVAVSASCRELLSDVVWIRGGIVVIGMATGTGVWCVIVITIVTSLAVVGDGCVCPDKLIEVIVNGESGWRPSGLGGVAGFAGCRQVECQVTWVGTLGIVIGMARCTGCRCVVVVTLVAVVTGRSCVRAGKGPVWMRISCR